ncbi:MAG: hypothetical protein O3B95_10625 [Chloroflexi bacterium]|nr:hypothetical protein [Chloroflexota bacterium]
MSKYVLLWVLFIATVVACDITSGSTTASSCDRLDEVLEQAGASGNNFSPLRDQARGRESLCVEALTQVAFQIDSSKTAEVELSMGLAAHSAANPTATARVQPTPLPLTATPLPTTTPTPIPAPTPSPLPAPTATSVPTVTPVPSATLGPPATQTPVPTATPVVHNTTPPTIEIPGAALPSLADMYWTGEDPIVATVGLVDTDFTLTASVYTPHDNGRGLWTWGVGLTSNNATSHIFIRSDSTIWIVNPSGAPVAISQQAFLVNEQQNTQNRIQYQVRGGKVTIFVNGTVAGTVTGLWNHAGNVSVGTNYSSTQIAQGFTMRTSGVTVSPSKITNDGNFDIAVLSEEENVVLLDTGEFNQVTAHFGNPFIVSHDLLDFGFRIGLPFSNRQLEIKQANYPGGVSTFYLSLEEKSAGTVFWQRAIPLPGHAGNDFIVEFREFERSMQLSIDGAVFLLTNLLIDFDLEHLEDVEVFVNSDQRVIDSQDARFLQSPYVRITGFGIWND